MVVVMVVLAVMCQCVHGVVEGERAQVIFFALTQRAKECESCVARPQHFYSLTRSHLKIKRTKPQNRYRITTNCKISFPTYVVPSALPLSLPDLSLSLVFSSAHHHARELQPRVRGPRLAEGAVGDEVEDDQVRAPDADRAEVVEDGVPDRAKVGDSGEQQRRRRRRRKRRRMTTITVTTITVSRMTVTRMMVTRMTVSRTTVTRMTVSRLTVSMITVSRAMVSRMTVSRTAMTRDDVSKVAMMLPNETEAAAATNRDQAR